MTSRREVGDYAAIVEALHTLIIEWRKRGGDMTANVPAAREAWMSAASEIAGLLGPEAQGALVPVQPSPLTLLDSAEAKLDRRDWVGAALDLIRIVRYSAISPEGVANSHLRARWEAAADRLLALVESVEATEAAAAAEAQRQQS